MSNKPQTKIDWQAVLLRWQETTDCPSSILIQKLQECADDMPLVVARALELEANVPINSGEERMVNASDLEKLLADLREARDGHPSFYCQRTAGVLVRTEVLIQTLLTKGEDKPLLTLEM